MSATSQTAPAAGGYQEVVTRALVREVDLPLGAGTAALITLDNGQDHRRPNTFGPAGVAALHAALDQVESRRDLVAVCVTGKPYVFAVGADLVGAAGLETREQAYAFCHRGLAVLRRFGELGVPTFALVNGPAMGGGLELALHCTYRTVSAAAGALSLPECLLGLVPGWGGAYLLPRLVGPERALRVIIENPLSQNRQLKPRDALDLGIVDAMLDPADFLEQSLRWTAEVVSGRRTVVRPDAGLADEARWDSAVAGARELVAARQHGASPAPLRALELVSAARTATRDDAFAAQVEALADLIMGDELRAGLYAFQLTQRRVKRPAGAPDPSLARPVTKVGVIGAGLMATQLAQLFARRLSVPVVITDLDQARVDAGLAALRDSVAAQVDKRRMRPDDAARVLALVSGSTDRWAFADADLVIEAVYEELAVKQQVLVEIEALVSDTCLLATNTSALSVAAMGSVLQHPERLVGLHFFNPVAVLPLLEVVRTPATDDATLATAFAVAGGLRKSGVLVKDAPAFVVNRLLLRLMTEVLVTVDEGTPLEVADHALDPLGLPMTPAELLGLVGPPVALHVNETLHAAFPDRFPVSATLRAAVDPAVAAAPGSAASTPEQVRGRALDGLAAEARLMLDEGVVSAPEDIDLCLLLGAGWPFHLGGLLPYLDRAGVSERVTGRRFLPRGVGSLPG